MKAYFKAILTIIREVITMRCLSSPIDQKKVDSFQIDLALATPAVSCWQHNIGWQFICINVGSMYGKGVLNSV